MSVPVCALNSSVPRCGRLPLPAEPYESLPGFAFAYAMSSGTLFTGSDGCTTST